MIKKLLWVDILKIIGMVGVIIIHIIGNTIATLGLTGANETIFNIIGNVCSFTLTLFVLVSGMLLLNKDINFKKVFFKYIKRILLVLIIFGSIFIFLEEYFYSKTINVNLFFIIIKRIFTGYIWDHMWYLYLMVALYLITPVLIKWIKHTSKKEQLFFLSILYVFTILSNEISNIIGFKIAFYIPISTVFVFVYLLGNYIYNVELSKKTRFLLYAFGIISMLIIILLTYFNKCNYIIGYTSSLYIIVATSIFCFFKNKKITTNKFFINVIKKLGECSFGIYIIHQFFINIIFKLLK